MKIRHRTGRRAFGAALAAAALTLATTAVVLPGANAETSKVQAPVLLAAAPSGVVPLTPQGAPQTIPGLSSWASATGEFTLGEGAKVIGADATLTEALAQQLSEVLERTVATAGTGASAGDVVVDIDASRSAALGEEGYELVVGDTLKVTGATDTGAFYGGQTILQLLTLGNRVAKGSSIDVPQYQERGVGLCACQVTISLESLERTMKDMAYNKLNQLWLETKLKSEAYPKANFWAYYTKEEAAQITAWAKKYHIELILEVNSPGHMRPWLYNYPELQLVNNSGTKKVEQLDISKPEAFEMVTTLADEYAAAFPDQPYWHMGGDEYMMGDSYANYPQFAAFVAAHPEIFPAGSGPGDVFIWFMNEVNAYVKSTGKQLRIWNDGVPSSSVIPLDKDIVVEHWLNSGPKPQALLDAGHDVQNSTQALYYNRPGNFTPNLVNLWNSGWTPRSFDGGTVVTDVPGKGKVVGAKLSIWPDNTPAATETEMDERMFGATRFVAQQTWGGPKPAADFPAFTALSNKLGNAPGYNSYNRTPVPNGGYAISTTKKSVNVDGDGLSVSDTGSHTWKLEQTGDKYYKLVAENGECLVMSGGVQWLAAPMDQDLAPTLSVCTATDRSVNNLQKWEILKVADGYTIRNAITQLPLSINPEGKLTQQAADVVPANVFTLTGAVSTSLQAPLHAVAGTPDTVTVTVDNLTANAMGATVVKPTVPAGWTVEPASVTLGDIAAGDSITASFTVTPTGNATYGNFTVSATTTYAANGETLVSNSSSSGLLSCSATPTRPVAAYVDSYNNGGGEVTPGSNAIDGDPNTFWGTPWTPSDVPMPHTIQVDLGKELNVCIINVLPRQGNGAGAINGRIKDYEVYVGDTKDDLGEKVAEGQFANAGSWQSVVLDAQAKGRFVTVKALSEQADQAWTTVAELTVDATAETPPTTEPTTDPTTEPTTDPTTEPTTEPTTDPTTDPTTEPTTDPTTDPTTEPTTDPTTEPTTEPTTDPTTEPTTEPTVNPAVEPTVAPSTATAGPSSSKTASVSTSSKEVQQGQVMTFTGSGFQPGENVRGTVHSEPVDLGLAVADADGNVTFTWKVPANFAAGAHTVTLTGETSKRTVEASFTVVAPGSNPSSNPSDSPAASDNLAKTGANTVALWGGALLLTLLGAAVVIGTRRRSGLHH